MKEFEEIEQKMKEELETVECRPFEDVFKIIKADSVKKEKSSKFKKDLFIRMMAVATCLIGVLTGIGLYNIFKPDESAVTNEYRYTEDEIEYYERDIDAILNLRDIYLPDLDTISEIRVGIGEHKETGEIVYFIIKGINESQECFREIFLKVIIQKKYEQIYEEEYTSGENILISNKLINNRETTYNDPFYEYKISFKVGNVRYLLDYQTITQNDVAEFLQIFLPV